MLSYTLGKWRTSAPKSLIGNPFIFLANGKSVSLGSNLSWLALDANDLFQDSNPGHLDSYTDARPLEPLYNITLTFDSLRWSNRQKTDPSKKKNRFLHFSSSFAEKAPVTKSGLELKCSVTFLLNDSQNIGAHSTKLSVELQFTTVVNVYLWCSLRFCSYIAMLSLQ